MLRNLLPYFASVVERPVLVLEAGEFPIEAFLDSEITLIFVDPGNAGDHIARILERERRVDVYVAVLDGLLLGGRTEKSFSSSSWTNG